MVRVTCWLQAKICLHYVQRPYILVVHKNLFKLQSLDINTPVFVETISTFINKRSFTTHSVKKTCSKIKEILRNFANIKNANAMIKELAVVFLTTQ